MTAPESVCDFDVDAFRWIDWRVMRDPAFQSLDATDKAVLLAFGLIAPRGVKHHLGFLSWCSGIDIAQVERSMGELRRAGFVERVDSNDWRLTDKADSWARPAGRGARSATRMTAPADGRNWKVVSPLNWEEVPAAPGVYVWVLDGQVGYIGQSSNLRGRLESYRYKLLYGGVETAWGQFANVVLKIRRTSYFGDWLMREARLIHRLRPLYNKRGPLSQLADA